MRVPALSSSCESPPPGCGLSISHCVLAWRQESKLPPLCSLLRELSPFVRPLPSSPNYIPETPLSNTHWGSGFQHMNFGGNKHLAHSTGLFLDITVCQLHQKTEIWEGRGTQNTFTPIEVGGREGWVASRATALVCHGENTSPLPHGAVVPGATPLWMPDKVRSFRSSHSAQDLVQDP